MVVKRAGWWPGDRLGRALGMLAAGEGVGGSLAMVSRECTTGYREPEQLEKGMGREESAAEGCSSSSNGGARFSITRWLGAIHTTSQVVGEQAMWGWENGLPGNGRDLSYLPR